MTLIDALKWRYATQKYDVTKPVSDQDLQTIIEAGNLAASSYGLQPYKILVIKDKATKEAIVPHAFGQQLAANNAVLLLLCARTDLNEAYITEYIERISKIRNIPVENLQGLKQAMIGDLLSRPIDKLLEYCGEQAYIALGSMMAMASELKVDNHAMGGFLPDKVDEALGLRAKNLHATVLLTLGYRSKDDTWASYPKVRKPLNEISEEFKI